MPIKTFCSQCQAKFELPERLAGKTVRCQKCQATFQVPELPVQPVPAETQPLNPIAAVDPPKPADDVVVATMVGPPPTEKDEEIVMAELVERADTAPKSKPTPSRSTRSRRPTPEPTGNTGTGAIIAVIVIGLFACLLLAGGGGAAVFFLALRSEPQREDFKGQKKDRPRRDFDDKKGWDFDKGGKGWKEERPKTMEPPFDFRTPTPVPWKTEAPRTAPPERTPTPEEKGFFKTEPAPKTTEAPKTEVPDKTAKISRIEDLPANERVFWQGIEFGPRRDVPVRFVSPIPKMQLRPNGTLFANDDTSVGISAFQADFEMGKRVNIGIQTGDVADVQVHDGDVVVAKDWCHAGGPPRLALSFVPRKTGPHAIYIMNRNPRTCYFSLEVAFPNKKPVEVSFVNSKTYKDKHSVTLKDNVIPRVKGFDIALSREYVVEVQAGKNYVIKTQSPDGAPFVRIERPNLTLLRNYGGESQSFSPSETGKYHFFVTNGTKAFFSYDLEITLRSDDG